MPSIVMQSVKPSGFISMPGRSFSYFTWTPKSLSILAVEAYISLVSPVEIKKTLVVDILYV